MPARPACPHASSRHEAGSWVDANKGGILGCNISVRRFRLSRSTTLAHRDSDKLTADRETRSLPRRRSPGLFALFSFHHEILLQKVSNPGQTKENRLDWPSFQHSRGFCKLHPRPTVMLGAPVTRAPNFAPIVHCQGFACLGTRGELRQESPRLAGWEGEEGEEGDGCWQDLWKSPG